MAGVTSQYVLGQRDLGIGGLNVQSLLADRRNKMEEVENLIHKHNIDIFVLGESWLPGGSRTRGELKDRLDIDDFTYERADSKVGGSYGGLIVYLRKEKITHDPVVKKWESPDAVQFLTISITKPTKFDLVAIYSPHSEHSRVVTAKMEQVLKKSDGTPVMFIGDLNIDPDRRKDAAAGRKLDELDRKFSTRRLIFPKTHEESCIDHIFTNIPEKGMVPIRSNVIPTSKTHTGDRYISDHNLILCRVKHHSAAAPGRQHPEAGSSDNSTCQICDKTFKNKHGLNTHIGKMHKNHYNDKQYERPYSDQAGEESSFWCSKCPDTDFHTAKELDHHVERHHCACVDCGQVCLNERGLSIHMRKMHDKSSTSATRTDQFRLDVLRHDEAYSSPGLTQISSTSTSTCPICDRVCKNEAGVKIHMGKMHKGGDSHQEVQSPKFHVPRLDQLLSSYSDYDVGVQSTYRTSSSLSASRSSGSSCPICGKVCKNEAGVNIHMGKMHKGGDGHQEVQSPTFRVPRLDQVLSSYSDYDVGVQRTYRAPSSLSAGGSSGSSCPICGKVCKNERGVSIHMGKMH